MINNYTEVVNLINNNEKILLLCHINPDADTIASALALKCALNKINKSVDILCDSVIDGTLNILPFISEINKKTTDDYTLVIAIDCSDKERLGVYSKYINNNYKLIAIDHHKSHIRFAEVTVLDIEAAATSELIYELICSINQDLIDNDIACLLYMALVTDSGSFSYSNVKPRTLLIASKLKAFDFPASDMIYDIYKKVNFNVFKMQSEVLYKTQFFKDNKVGIIVFTKELFEKYNLTISMTDGAVNKVLDIDTVFIAIAITEVAQNSYKVSIRSKNPYSADYIASKYGGGGHFNAAGCRINGNIYNVIEGLVKNSSDELNI